MSLLSVLVIDWYYTLMPKDLSKGMQMLTQNMFDWNVLLFVLCHFSKNKDWMRLIWISNYICRSLKDALSYTITSPMFYINHLKTNACLRNNMTLVDGYLRLYLGHGTANLLLKPVPNGCYMIKQLQTQWWTTNPCLPHLSYQYLHD